MSAPKCALQKMFEKFLMLSGGLFEITNGEGDDLKQGLSVMLCKPKTGSGAEPQLVLAHCTWDSDGEMLATVPLAALLPKEYIDRLQPDFEKSAKLTEVFYRKLVEKVKPVDSFSDFNPDYFNPAAGGAEGGPDADWDEVCDDLYPVTN